MKASLLLLIATLLISPMLQAEEFLLELQDGSEVPMSVYKAEGETALLWLPSEFGGSPRLEQSAEMLAQLGIEVWLADFHTAWFLPVGRYSFRDISSETVREVIRKTREVTKKTLYVAAPGRSAARALEALHQWQQTGMEKDAFGGAILFHPKLYDATPQGGEEAKFLPIVRATNLPLYIYQPENSAHYWHADKLRQALEEAGATVFLHLLQDVSDGFNIRLDHSDSEEMLTRELPRMIQLAMELMAKFDVPAEALPLKSIKISKNGDKGRATLLKPYKGKGETPPLAAETLDGNRFDLSEYEGKVAVINFWATWCPPCVEELPSLDRMKKLVERLGVLVVSVDVGESPNEIREFLKDKPISFPVLLDPDAKAFKAWNSYAFPTTFILDRNHRIRYAVFGAFEWDSEEVLMTLEQLLSE